MKLTKKNALRIFKDVLNTDHVYYANIRGDKVAMRESWNNFTDSLCKDGEITESQYNTWSNPFQGLTNPPEYGRTVVQKESLKGFVNVRNTSKISIRRPE